MKHETKELLLFIVLLPASMIMSTVMFAYVVLTSRLALCAAAIYLAYKLIGVL